MPKVYTLDAPRLQNILARYRQRMKEGSKPLYKDEGKRLRCQHCRQLIAVNSKVVSKLFGHNRRIHYHIACAKTVHIV